MASLSAILYTFAVDFVYIFALCDEEKKFLYLYVIFLHNCTYLTLTLLRPYIIKSRLASTPILFVIVQGITLVWMPSIYKKNAIRSFRVGISGGRLLFNVYRYILKDNLL